MGALERLGKFLSASADANSPPVTPALEAETEAFFSHKHREHLEWMEKFFRRKEDPNGRIKVLGGIIVGIVSTATGAALIFSPPSFLPENIKQAGCRDSGPAFLYAGLGILAGFAVQKI
jgi:hypothetical protein